MQIRLLALDLRLVLLDNRYVGITTAALDRVLRVRRGGLLLERFA